jgi:hypothetical protein
MPGSTPIEDKIAALLTKAESTTPEEAEALTEAAEKLMLRYGLERAAIDARREAGTRGEEIIEVRVTYPGSYGPQLVTFGHRIAMALGGIQVIQSPKTRYSDAVMYLIGFEGDVRAAQSLIASLNLQAKVACDAWWKTYDRKEWLDRHNRSKERWSFMLSFASGAAERIRRNKRVAVEEAGTGTDLVLASRKDQVEAWVGEHYSGLRAGRARNFGGSSSAYVAGVSAGRNARTGEAAVTTPAGIGA